MRLALPLLLFAVLALAAYAPSPAPAANGAPAVADTSQWQNLQVLPDSLSRDELIDLMRGFARSLGVRCDHCHVRQGEEFDFPSDANPQKDIARGMIRMTWQINAEILPAIPGLEAMGHGEGAMADHEHPEGMAHEETRHHAGPRVTCWTCHRGAPVPETMAPMPEEGQQQPDPPAEEHHDDHEHHDDR